jgi:integrase
LAYIYKPKGSPRYRIQFRNEAGKIKDVKGFTNLKSTQIEAARLEDEIIRIKRGTLNAQDRSIAAAETLELSTHLDEWRADIIARGSSKDHADLCRFRVANVFGICADGKGYVRVSQINVVEVQGAIRRLMDEGLGQQTANHVIQSCKQFSRWLWKHHRAKTHALDDLKKYALTDIRRQRTNIAWSDVVRMIQHVEGDKTAFAGRFKIPSADRAMMYRVAAATGFRRGALRSLVPESFNLSIGEATVTVLPGYSKNKKALTVPISDDMAVLLAKYLAKKIKGERLWDIPEASAKMLRADFKRAGITFPDDKLARDFHCLRHTYISSMVEAGVDLKTVQELAGHSVITLTQRYAHSSPDQKRRAINKLPAIPPNSTPPA